MKRRHVRFILLTVCAFILTPLAVAQEVPSGTEFTPVNAPANVLYGEPRDFPGQDFGMSCRNDPLMGEIPVQCRRWSEIASGESAVTD